MEREQELRAMTAVHAQLAGLTPHERMRALAWLLVTLEVDVVDVYQEAKRLDLLHQRGLVQGRPVEGSG
ncbi:hypothetical protein ABT300_30145 [Streptomyces sp. NPDC001027]|uniref:hypothetical protein n=1 Tax=Streptomyces sp. NPDC001027 TaxID=3154771 RepID=UPI003333B207